VQICSVMIPITALVVIPLDLLLSIDIISGVCFRRLYFNVVIRWAVLPL